MTVYAISWICFAVGYLVTWPFAAHWFVYEGCEPNDFWFAIVVATIATWFWPLIWIGRLLYLSRNRLERFIKRAVPTPHPSPQTREERISALERELGLKEEGGM